MDRLQPLRDRLAALRSTAEDFCALLENMPNGPLVFDIGPEQEDYALMKAEEIHQDLEALANLFGSTFAINLDYRPSVAECSIPWHGGDC